jgi:hypothetical protein
MDPQRDVQRKLAHLIAAIDALRQSIDVAIRVRAFVSDIARDVTLPSHPLAELFADKHWTTLTQTLNQFEVCVLIKCRLTGPNRPTMIWQRHVPAKYHNQNQTLLAVIAKCPN